MCSIDYRRGIYLTTWRFHIRIGCKKMPSSFYSSDKGKVFAKVVIKLTGKKQIEKISVRIKKLEHKKKIENEG